MLSNVADWQCWRRLPLVDMRRPHCTRMLGWATEIVEQRNGRASGEGELRSHVDKKPIDEGGAFSGKGTRWRGAWMPQRYSPLKAKSNF